MLENIWKAPTSTVASLAACITIVLVAAMCTGHNDVISDILKFVGGAVLGGGAMAGRAQPEA